MVSQGVLIAVGISEQGYRAVLGWWIADSESETNWGAVFGELKQRGLRGVRYVVPDDHAGLVRAIGRHFQNVVCGGVRCIFVRNALSLCGVRERPLVLRLMKNDYGSAERSSGTAGAAAGDPRAGEESAQGGGLAGGARRGDTGRVRAARGTSQTNADDASAGAAESGTEAANAGGAGVSE